METDRRPTPEEMLDRARAEERSRQPGKLRIFFGAAPGVGKTYAMLEAARQRRAEGIDVVIGWVETHGRRETEALVEGFERIPPHLVPHRGLTLREFDLEAALARRPTLLLVDELAHTNAPGSKHGRRFQDVEELLDSGIDVYTTLNVQHLESLNDVVAQISGVVVRETVPDSVFERADEVELVDLTPDDLLKRLREGKVYIPAQAERAIENFFRKGNLIALRELALQRTAERVDAQMARWKREEGIAQPWLARERILAAIGPAPQSGNLVRAAYRMATRLGAPWIVLWVETPGTHKLPTADQERIQQHLTLAEQLGGETVVLTAEHVGDTVLQLARQRNVTRILVGKPTHSRWHDRWRGSLVDELVRGSGPIDVIATRGDDEVEMPRPRLARERTPLPVHDYLRALAVVVVATAICWLTRPIFDLADQAMIYLLGVLYVASRSPRGPALLASLASVAALDFFFVPPFFTFAVSNVRYLVTFGVMLVTAVLVSSLTVRNRSQAQAARERERRTAILYALTRSFAFRRSVDEIAEAAAAHVEVLFEVEAAVLLVDGGGPLIVRAGADHAFVRDERELTVARWVFEHGRPAGRSTDTLPAVKGLYLPLVGGTRTLGVLGIAVGDRQEPFSASQRQILDVFVKQAALALERALLAEETERTRLAAETERLRNTLLATMSHDLRTPIAAITGAATSLLDESTALASEDRRGLLETIREEAERLNRIVRDLLDLNRIESGAVAVHKEWCPLEDIVGSALVRLDEPLSGREVKVQLPPSLLVVPVDPVLLEQVLTNLLENAAKYTPPGSPIDIDAEPADGGVMVSVGDRGPGVPAEDLERVFEKFHRLSGDGTVAGTGLGLAICRAILTAHGGRIWAENREGGGARFRFFLPLEDTAPSVDEKAT
jgi:two-component system sensor histidine kinase KdpD